MDQKFQFFRFCVDIKIYYYCFLFPKQLQVQISLSNFTGNNFVIYVGFCKGMIFLFDAIFNRFSLYYNYKRK